MWLVLSVVASVTLSTAMSRRMFAPTIAVVLSNTGKVDAALLMIGEISDEVLKAQRQMVGHLRNARIRSNKIKALEAFPRENRERIIMLEQRADAQDRLLQRVLKECRP